MADTINEYIAGNILLLKITPEGTIVNYDYTLPDGYTIEQCYIRCSKGAPFVRNSNQSAIPIKYATSDTAGANQLNIFPRVAGKSPSVLPIRITGLTAATQFDFEIAITKFGGIPDAHYFDGAFTPIEINGYNRIPE